MRSLLFTMRLIWGAIFASNFIYAGILLLEVIPPGSNVAPLPMLPVVFAAVAVLVAAMSFVLPKVVYKQAAEKSSVRIEEEPVPGVFAAGYREAAPERKVFADPEAALHEAMKCSMTPLILGIAMSEATSLLGFVLGFLGLPLRVWAPFMIGGAALIAIRFPTINRVKAAFEAVRGASFPEKAESQG